MRRFATTLSMAVCLIGCTTAALTGEAPKAPSGKPISVVGYGINGDMTCPDRWVEGLLRADVALESRLTGASEGPIAIEVWPLDSVVWPSGVEPERFLPVRWPLEYSGVRLANGEVAVVNGTGELVAMTGSRYRLKGEWAVVGATGGPLFGKPPWIDGFNVCRGSRAAVPA